MKKLMKTQAVLATGVLIFANLVMAETASAHCDGLDGPVINEARSALEKKMLRRYSNGSPKKASARSKKHLPKRCRKDREGK